MKQARKLLERDNTPEDLDDRSGHLSLPHLQFEAHPESGYSFRQGALQVRGDEQACRVTQMADGSLASEQQAEWRLDEKLFTFEYVPAMDPEYPPSSQGKSLVTSGRFSLEGSEVVGEDQKTAKRVKEILNAVELWEQNARELDQQPGDLNAKEGRVAAPQVSREALSLEGEKVLTQSFLFGGPQGDEMKDFEVFDLEQSDHRLLVAGNLSGWGKPLAAGLTVETSGQTKKVVVERPEVGAEEHLVWDTGTGQISYQKFQKG